ncbi:sensor histidine kinase [Falsiroseomonas oryzae]|uniref:sensor histidine kinase n=1 Tax=Falsiroseomonas oryzae TaxID=2766473 RepID=UPI0022EB91A5|nr:ATP-binding protein [Roseomonas sp. MO-31]
MRLWPGSMGGRLALSLGAGLFVLWLLSAATAALVVVRELNEVFDSILQETAQILLADITTRHAALIEADQGVEAIIVSQATPHDEYITWRLFTPDGRLVMRSHGASEAPMPPPGFADIGRARTYTERAPDGRFLLSVAEPPEHRPHTINPTLWRLLTPLLALVVAALVLIPPAVRRGFAPVARLQAEIAQRGGANLSPVQAPDLPAELAAMRDDVNLLLRRLRQALEAERSFSANAAHEMRTPVAATLAQAQLLTARLAAESPERRDAEEMVAGLRRLGSRLEKLLQLARAEAGVGLQRTPVDLLVPLHLLVEEFAAQPDVAGRLRLDDGGLPALMVDADLDALGIALRNLIENALRHGPPGGVVHLTALASGGVRVVNGGAPLPPERLPLLTRRFVSHGGGGSGLGLSIVQAIAEQLGGTLTLHSPATGREDGFEAILALPLAGSGTGRIKTA